MKIDSRITRQLLWLFAATLVAGNVFAQAMPSKMRLILAFAPGGPTDLSARIIGEKLRIQLGIPVIVDNRPSGNGAIAAGLVKQAPPDGETLLYASSSMLTITPHIEKSLPYDPFADFEPVTGTVYVDAIFVTRPDVPANSLAEFFKFARSRKPSLSIASSGVGSLSHGYIELLKEAGKVELLHVPYKGAAPALADVLSGQVDGFFVGASLPVQYIRSGKLKAYGVAGPKRIPVAPEIPTFDEQGYPGFHASWNGILAPKGTPPALIKALAGAVAQALNQEDVKSKLLAAGITPWVVFGDEFTQFMRAESDTWKRLLGNKGSAGG